MRSLGSVSQIKKRPLALGFSCIEKALKQFPVEEAGIAFLHAQSYQAILHGIEDLWHSDQLSVVEEQWSKLPVTGISMCFEGWSPYSTSLYFALGLPRYVTRYYNDKRLRCTLFFFKKEGERLTAKPIPNMVGFRLSPLFIVGLFYTIC